ncbi:MAG: hypothetical protein ACLGIG_00615 [Actinomycetes bacterium]
MCAAVLALGAGGIGLAQAQASGGYKVNGGGQVLLGGSENGGGPGDTVAFTAHQFEDSGEDAGPARGQFQYVERSGDNGNVHGSVTCLRVDGDRAIIEGVVTRGEQSTFRIDLFDAGRGAQGDDIVTVTFHEEDSECEDDIAEDDDFRLARGNVTIHEPAGSQE